MQRRAGSDGYSKWNRRRQEEHVAQVRQAHPARRMDWRGEDIDSGGDAPMGKARMEWQPEEGNVPEKTSTVSI
ncbi:unnamed protein product [Lampetra planeri]